MKKLLTTILFICLSAASFAQSGKATVTIVDAKTKEGIAGAVVELTSVANPEKVKQYVSGFAGKTSIPTTKYGEYDVVVTFLGYEDTKSRIKIDAANKDLGNIELAESATKIDAVVKEVQAIRASTKGDTVSYNASAYKVTGDADVEGLLKKMPGITVSNGTVEAQGETIKKIFVDGKEFFGEDVTTAINSLPAQAVKSIQVYNKLSDNAEFSGREDRKSVG